MLLTVIILGLALYWLWIYKYYYKSTYYTITRNSYFTVKQDTGLYGEYQIFCSLRDIEKEGGRFLFNIYVPGKDGRTSEIDLLLITKEGIFVFESKNYSGWIFGSENQLYWTQTLPIGRGHSQKNSFYNPIMQNTSHICHLREFLGTSVPMYSVIVFSDRCTLKKVNYDNEKTYVVHRTAVAETVREVRDNAPLLIMSNTQMQTIYDRLYPCTQLTDEEKEQHIKQIKKH